MNTHAFGHAAGEPSSGLYRLPEMAPGTLQDVQALLATAKAGAVPSNLAHSKVFIGLAMAESPALTHGAHPDFKQFRTAGLTAWSAISGEVAHA